MPCTGHRHYHNYMYSSARRKIKANLSYGSRIRLPGTGCECHARAWQEPLGITQPPALATGYSSVVSGHVHAGSVRLFLTFLPEGCRSRIIPWSFIIIIRRWVWGIPTPRRYKPPYGVPLEKEVPNTCGLPYQNQTSPTTSKKNVEAPYTHSKCRGYPKLGRFNKPDLAPSKTTN